MIDNSNPSSLRFSLRSYSSNTLVEGIEMHLVSLLCAGGCDFVSAVPMKINSKCEADRKALCSFHVLVVALFRRVSPQD